MYSCRLYLSSLPVAATHSIASWGNIVSRGIIDGKNLSSNANHFSQVSERVIREIAWDVIPGLAEKLIRAEIERIKARAESERD